MKGIGYYDLLTRHQPGSGLGAISSLETCACKSIRFCLKPTWGVTLLASRSRLDMTVKAKQVLAALLLLAHERNKC